jgi:capsular exopolysaccharide synthesis family protein
VVGLSFSGVGQGLGAQLEIIRSQAVLGPVVDSVNVRLTILDDPGLRSDIFTDLVIAPDAPGAIYLMERVGDEISVVHEYREEEVARVPGGSRIDLPGLSFGPFEAAFLEDPIRFAINRRQVAIERLQSRVLVEEGLGPDMIRLQFTDSDPRHAAAVLNQTAASYIEYSKGSNKAAQARRRAAIADQMVLLADSLRAAQDQSMQYQSEARLLDPSVEGNALMTNMLTTETELQAMRFDESVLESMVTGLQNSDGSDESLHRIMALGGNLVPGGSQLDSELRDLEAQRSRLTASQFGLTQANPEVVIIDSLLASTKQQMQITAEQALALQRARIESTERRLGGVRGQLSRLPARSAEFSRLEQRVTAIQQSFDLLVAQYFQAQIEEGAEAGDVQVVDPAPVPLRPNPARRGLKLAVALLAGLMIGGVGAITLDQLDSRVRQARDVERAVHLQVLGSVPKISSRSSNPKSVLIGKEAFRGLRTNIRFALREQPRLLAITSSAPGEGKSTIAVNLALTLAEQGSRVLLIDADLRRPQVHRILGVERLPGLSDVLMGEAELDHAIVRSPVHPGLSVIPGGSATGSPAELVGGDAFMRMVLELREQYDTVLVDTSPVLAVTDAALIGTVADGTLVVVRANETDQGALSQAVEQLRRVNANLVGIVLNDVPLDNVGYSSYYDSYYDGEREDTRTRHLLRSGGRSA